MPQRSSNLVALGPEQPDQAARETPGILPVSCLEDDRMTVPSDRQYHPYLSNKGCCFLSSV